MRVRRSELPRLLGVTRQQVSKDVRDGLYRAGNDGLFDLDEVRAGRALRHPIHGGRREPSRPVPVPARGEVLAVFRELAEATACYVAAEDAADANPLSLALDRAAEDAFGRMRAAADRALDAAHEAVVQADGRPNLYSEAPPAVKRLLDLFGVSDALPGSAVGDEVGELVWKWTRECVPDAIRECRKA